MKNTLQNDLLLRAARREKTERAPVWFMRQAGRYLPEYRQIRAKHDFLTMVKTPELAAEVTIQPVDLVGVDAAIIFSDILTVPEAMGMKLVIEEGKGGPRFPDPIRLYTQIRDLKDIDPTRDLKYVADAITLTVDRLAGRVPLIGFSGAPWTLFCYMVEGSGSKDFRYAKEMIFTRPDEAHKLLQKIAGAVADYLVMQIEAGADVVQIFDTWAGILTPNDFRDFSLQYIGDIVRDVKKRTNNRAPVIVFCKGANQSLLEIATTGCDVIGLDWTIDIAEVKALIGDEVALQGNLDPSLLFASEEVITDRVNEIAENMGDCTGHIFNLGHGITPDVDPDRARAFVRAAKAAYQK
ncbi:MAG: uroporphyrinogen decarboxylase [Bacteroidota bacterium]|nr:uroporphyrinogen decarboxylase [Bacteroidota bacterium]MDP4230636.1 uroporphyrinogen decarboxylase [Bacteroidota bacterium]MDP4236839.1 uroporphyrinogen decarboxylase [Bacteroidota bacterium]